jgi:hypothetical protein
MSRYIATRAIRGAQGIVREAEEAVNAALAELELNTGTQFDPLVVEVLADFVREPVAVAA